MSTNSDFGQVAGGSYPIPNPGLERGAVEDPSKSAPVNAELDG